MAGIALKDGFSAAWFREQSVLAKDAKVARRLLSLAAIKEGYTRSDAAKIGGMDRQTLCDWVHRFNAEGVDGLKEQGYANLTARPVGRGQSPSAIETF